MPPSLGEIPEVPPDGPASLARGAEEGTPAAELSAPSVEASALDIAQPDIPADGFCSEASRTDSDAATGAPPMPATSSEDKKKSEMIVIWRPDRSAFLVAAAATGSGETLIRLQETNIRRTRSSAARIFLAAARGVGAGESETRADTRSWPQLAKQAGRQAAVRPDRREPVRFDEKHRQTSSDRDMPRSHSASERQPRATVDPNSPFAKLLELEIAA